MHAVDYLNCSQGISGVNNGEPYLSDGSAGEDWGELSGHKHFPPVGFLSRIDDDRQWSDAAATWRCFTMSPTTECRLLRECHRQRPIRRHCVPDQPNGTTTEYEEGIDRNQTFLNGIDGISTSNGDGGINSIDPTKLPRDPYNNCAPVYPWNFVRTNTVFGVIHGAGGYTAWSGTSVFFGERSRQWNRCG